MGHHYTPLRYPGGKQKISPFINEILLENNLIGGQYVEPYAGGAGVGIELLLRGQVSRIHLNDIDPAVYAFWHSILKETEEFCYRISRASLSIEEWRKQREILREKEDVDRFDLGYAMFYLNRCNRSGILSGGVIGGLKQNGEWKMDARFPRNDLIRRIESIARLKRFIKIRNWDAEKFIIEYLPRLPPNTLVYCDPPYYNKSQKLYHSHYSPQDHYKIAKIIQHQIKKPWIVSYDNCPEIIRCYKNTKKFVYNLQYNAAKSYLGQEVLIFSKKIKIPVVSSVQSINQSLARGINN